MTTSARAMHSRQQIPTPPQRDGIFSCSGPQPPASRRHLRRVAAVGAVVVAALAMCAATESGEAALAALAVPPSPSKWSPWGMGKMGGSRPALRADATLRPRVTYALQQFPVLRDAAAKGLDSAGAAANTCPKLPHCNDCDGRGWQELLGPLVSFYYYCLAGSRRSDRRLPSKVRILSNISKCSGLLLVFCLII